MRAVYRLENGVVAEAEVGAAVNGVFLGVWIDGSFHGRFDADVPRAPKIELRAIRERLCLTQGELAALMGTSTANISRWERGVVGMSPKIRKKLQNIVDTHGGMP
jgi:DNA-binding XRE family transcriptional regulator